MVFTSYGNRNKDIDTRIQKANAVSACVLRMQFCNKCLSAFKSAVASILICGHELRVTTERILFQEQAAEMGFLRSVQGVTLCDKVHRFEICKSRNVTPHFSESKDPSYVDSTMCPVSPRKDSRRKSCWLHLRESTQEV